MNNSMQSEDRQEKSLSIFSLRDQSETIAVLVKAGIEKHEITIDEIDQIIVPFIYEPIVAACCPSPEYTVSPIEGNFDALRIQNRIAAEAEKVALLEREHADIILPYEESKRLLDFYKTKIAPSSELQAHSFEYLHQEMEATIAKHFEKGIIGLSVPSIPAINEKMLGLRGLIFLTAAPNCGKTVLATQFGLDALIADSDVCMVFVSLEMTPAVIFERSFCYFSDMTFRQLHFKSDHDFFENKERARKILLQDLSRRFAILGAKECENITPELLLRFVENLKKESGCSRAYIAIDYLQLWPNNSGKKDLDADKWLMDEMKLIQRQNPEDPVVVIAEARKPSKSGDDWATDLADLSGSGRLGYGADVVLNLNPIAEKSFIALAETNGIIFTGDSSNARKDEFKRAVYMEMYCRGSSLIYLSTTKIRHGMEKFRSLLEFSYHKNIMKPATCINSGDILQIAKEKVFSIKNF